jgi:tRNA(Ile2) C34 agmatinyltransferase TiaS
VASKRHRKVFTSRASTRRHTDKIIAARRERQELARAAEEENVLKHEPTVTVTCPGCKSKNPWAGQVVLRCFKCGEALRTGSPQQTAVGPRIQSR